MRWLLLSAFSLAAVMVASGQAATGTTQSVPDDPQKLLAAAEPFYDFNSPELKPWHLKASYQLYDDKGKPTEQGTYEYWWASPKVYRSTWTRKGATYSEWHTADDRTAIKSSGGRLQFFEDRLRSELISPLSLKAGPSNLKTGLTFRAIRVGKLEVPCIAQPSQSEELDCFDPGTSALLFTQTYGLVTTEFSDIRKVQGRYLSFGITVFGGAFKRFSAVVSDVGGLSPSDPSLVPPPDAPLEGPPEFFPASAIKAGGLLKRTAPAYPASAKASGLQGVVLLGGRIEGDGKVHDLEIIASPDPSLSDSAISAVSHWEYKPFTVNGKPIAVETIVHVVFKLGP